MKSLIKILLIIAACFAATFIIIKMTGILKIAQNEDWLTMAQEASPVYVGTLVVILLFADLFIAVPTLTIVILSGYFLGFDGGAVASAIGMVAAGVAGYLISRYYGDSILGYLLKDDQQRHEAVATFTRHGFIMILLSRAVPILPEVTACLSGISRMKFPLFLCAWLISTLPYLLIASYAGSVSTLENPKPAIFTAIGLSLALWIAWLVFHRLQKKASPLTSCNEDFPWVAGQVL